MKYFILFLKEHKGKVVWSILLLLGQVVGTLLIPMLVANIIDHGILQKDMNVIIFVGIQMLLVALFASFISVLGSWATSDLGALFGYVMRTKLFRKVQGLSLQQFNDIGVSSLITRSTSDITHLQQTFGMFLQMVAPAPLIVIVSMMMTARISMIIACVQLAFMIVLILLAVLVLKKSNNFSKQIQSKLDRINKVLRESITGVRVIRAFGNEQYEEQRSANTYRDYADNMIHLNRLFAVFTPAVWVLMGGIMVIVLALGGIFTLEGSMNIGEISAVSEYATLTMAYLMMGVATLTTLPKARSCMKRLEEVLDTLEAIEDASITTTQETSDLLVEFDHVHFAYAGAQEPVIKDLSFQLHYGQTTAVIGSTGSGKSTIADLLLRLHDIQEGCIRIKGIDIRQIPQHDLRECIAAVPQKAFLFSGTIADNLRMGNEDATDAAMWHALEIAQAKEFVESLALQLQAPVSQGGTNFSGGQRQRISIARALVKQADIFVFDDSFSALDVKTDAKLRHALRKQIEKPTKLIIAQRISSILDADQILVLHEGELVGQGTHTQLLQTCDVYRSIAESQMKQKEVSSCQNKK